MNEAQIARLESEIDRLPAPQPGKTIEQLKAEADAANAAAEQALQAARDAKVAAEKAEREQRAAERRAAEEEHVRQMKIARDPIAEKIYLAIAEVAKTVKGMDIRVSDSSWHDQRSWQLWNAAVKDNMLAYVDFDPNGTINVVARNADYTSSKHAFSKSRKTGDYNWAGISKAINECYSTVLAQRLHNAEKETEEARWLKDMADVLEQLGCTEVNQTKSYLARNRFSHSHEASVQGKTSSIVFQISKAMYGSGDRLSIHTELMGGKASGDSVQETLNVLAAILVRRAGYIAM